MQCTSSEFSSPFTVARARFGKDLTLATSVHTWFAAVTVGKVRNFGSGLSPVGRAISPHKPAKGAPHGLRIDSF
jgi:hypothetical protein